MALGRGLESLIPQKSEKPSGEGGREAGAAPARSASQAKVKQENVFYIEISKIKPNPHQPRGEFEEGALKSLSASIQKHGILQPLLVSKHEIKTDSGQRAEYHIIAGERRWRAAKLAGFSQVPVIVRSTDEQGKLELALIENIQRANLNPIEEARAYQKLAENFSLTQEQIATRVAKSRELVANKIRLLGLPYNVQKVVAAGQLTEGHAKVLLSLKNPEKQIFLAAEAIKKNWSVRKLTDRIKLELEPTTKLGQSNPTDPELEQYKKNIQEVLGTRVDISGSREKGKLAINFYSRDELRRIIDKLIEGSS